MESSKEANQSSKALDGSASPVSESYNGSLHDVKPSSFWSRFLHKIQLEESTGNVWSNADLDPVPQNLQTWRTHNFVTYWLCDAVAPGNLRLGSSLMTLGFSWKATVGIITLGHGLIGVLIAANGVIGAKYHIPYTIQSRSSFGFFCSFAVVFIRMLVGFFWYGINAYTGAQCVDAVIVAIWPSFNNVPNRLPESAAITTQMMTAYIIYFLICLPFHYIHPRHMRWFFDVKSILCIPAIFGMLAWACNIPGGGMNTPLMNKATSLSGSTYTWAYMSGLNSMLGNYGTMAVNINDFARYAPKKRMVFVQILIVPLSFMLMAFMGMIIAGSASQLYGEDIWDPLTIMAHWTGSGRARTGAAFVGLAFVLAQLGSNISANCISAANDLNAMFPKYINLRRGSFIIAFIGAWALSPWKILSSAGALLNFMDGYTIWLAPITGILLADYYVTHRMTYDVADLYAPDGRYRYNRYGTNWRAIVAWLFGCVPMIPGFAASMESASSVSQGSKNFYKLGYLYGFFVSFSLYAGISRLFPARSTIARAEETGHVIEIEQKV